MADKISSEVIMRTLREQLSQINATVDEQEASVVTEAGDGIAHISGLKTAMAGELLQFTSSTSGKSVFGLAQNLDEAEVGAVLFGDVDAIKEGDEVRTTGRVMDMPGHARPRREPAWPAHRRPRPHQHDGPPSHRVQGPWHHGAPAGLRARSDWPARR